jgi:hypothetical protein
MKKLYFKIIFAGLAANFAYGQYAPKMSSVSKILTTEQKPSETAAPKALGTTIWSDDFTTATNWTIDNAGQTDPTLYGWDIGTTEQSWFSTITTINSTSDGKFAEVKNGDYFDNSQLTNVTYSLTTASPINIDSLVNDLNPALDAGSVTLAFQQYGALFNDDQQVQISTDGINFVTVFTNNERDIFVGNNNSAIYANPENISVNLASFLTGGSTSVWIRFTWTSRFPADTDPAAWTTFGWFIDDVSITTNPDYDVEVTSTSWGSNGLTYYQIPLLQVAPIDFLATVLNNGIQTVNNVQLNVSVNGTAAGTSNASNVAPLDTVTLNLTTAYTPSSAATGTYAVTQTITSTEVDDVPTNNAIANVSFSTTNYIYARDNNVVSGTTYGDGTTSFETGNLFEIFQNQTVKAINVRLTGGNGGTPVGTEIYARLYGIDPATGDFVYAGESAPLVVSNANLSTNLVIPLLSPVDLIAGEAYLAVVGSYDPALVVSNAGTTAPQTSFFLDGNDIGSSTLFYQTNVPYVRLNFDPVIGIEENTSNAAITSVYPNPTAGSTTVKYTLKNASDVKVVITDLTGKLISEIKNNAVSAGEQTLNFDASSYSNGVYYVTISTEESTVTRKFVKK